tara:strand:+ start:61 stop:711 length:651 start_codon:yes stop_codon:yes gene_type:complete
MNIDIIKAHNEYGMYAIPKSSAWRIAAQTVIEENVWEHDTIKYIIKNCEHSSIIHAGAYFGDFIPALSKNCKHTVFAFEPNSENYECANMTCDLNNCTNVILRQNALGDCRKIVNLKIRHGNKSIGGLSKIVSMADKDTEEALQVTIDDTIPHTRPVSILHLDLEGHELSALKGAKNIIKKWKPIVIIEDNHKEYSLLANLNYVYQRTINKNLIFE